MADLYEFKMKYVDRPDDAYYHTRWDKAKPVSVVAGTREEAFKKLWALLGETRRGRHWMARVVEIRDARLVRQESSDG